MQTATFFSLPNPPQHPSIGGLADPDFESSMPGDSEPKYDSAKQAFRSRKKEPALPLFPFFVRNDEPTLREFLIF